MGYREQGPPLDPATPAEAYFRMGLFKNGVYNDRLTHSSIFLRNVSLPSRPSETLIPLDQEWEKAVDKLIKRVGEKEIDVTGTLPAEISFERQVFNKIPNAGFTLNRRDGKLVVQKAIRLSETQVS